MPVVLLTYYCVLILAASIVGGMIPVWFRLTHRGMEFAVSFVAGVMLGIGVLHMLPHALADAAAAAAARGKTDGSPLNNVGRLPADAVWWTMLWLLAGMLAMFFIERFFSFHQHDVSHTHEYDRTKDVQTLSWSGAALGLALHSVLNGVALAAAVLHGHEGAWLAGFGTFLVIFLHKPLDAMTIGMLMARGGWSLPWRHTVNALFSLAIPAGAVLFYFGLMQEASDPPTGSQNLMIAYALAFSAGTFLCISLSDLLPELQFHQHDRVKLSAALLLGLGVAYAAGRLEAVTHDAHEHAVTAAVQAGDEWTRGVKSARSAYWLRFAGLSQPLPAVFPSSSAGCLHDAK